MSLFAPASSLPKMTDNPGKTVIPPDVQIFLRNPLYPDQFEISTHVLKEHALGIPLCIKKYLVTGDPVECTIECDYSTINVSGNSHRIHITGVRNQVNIIGTCHSIFFEGFNNQVNYCTDVPNGQIWVKGDSPLSYQTGVSNGKINSNDTSPSSPKKLVFPAHLNFHKRRRLCWQSATSAATCFDTDKDQELGKDDDDEMM